MLYKKHANVEQCVILGTITPTMSFTFALWILTLMIIIIVPWKLSRPSKRVYLMDFACYKAKESQSVTKVGILEQMRLICNLTQDSLVYCKKILDRSGLGESTYMADALLEVPARTCVSESRKEAEDAAFAAIEEVLRKTGVGADEVGIVVANCSIFSPAPSLSAMVVNRFGMRKDVKTFNLSGMGCSASLAAIGLANQLLQVHENSYALVVSTESITENAYKGQNKTMLVINCFFRVGGAAILLSNHGSAGKSAKYRLEHSIPTHTAGSNPPSYSCIFQEEDSDGLPGISVTKHLLTSANRAIRANLAIVGPLVLPMKAQLLYLSSQVRRKLLRLRHVKPYVPDFKLAFDHFFPHVGGKPVLDELARALGLDEVDMEAARMTLHRFGNTSSSSVWYEMAYAEAKGRVKKGDRVWQVAFGSGFKCSSVVWRAVRSVGSKEVGNPWADEIDGFPVLLVDDGIDDIASLLEN